MSCLVGTESLGWSALLLRAQPVPTSDQVTLVRWQSKHIMQFAQLNTGIKTGKTEIECHKIQMTFSAGAELVGS